MSDPMIVQKIEAGREDDIRRCVGATYCLDRNYQAGEALCILKPATGCELSIPHISPTGDARKRAVIIGAGPDGLEATGVAAERGHEVTVFDAAPDPDGQTRLTAQSKHRSEMIGIIDWRMAKCAARDVAFHFNTQAGSEDIPAPAPDVVIVATGGLPETAMPDAGNDPATIAWDIPSGDAQPGENVLISEDAGVIPP